MKPAWSWQFEQGHLPAARVDLPHEITPEWAWGDSTGVGIKVAVVDSGVDATHPAVGRVDGAVAVEYDPEVASGIRFVEGPHEDLYGHGTACAAIIRALAPDCEIHSVRVLGKRLTGKGFIFAAGVRWAIDNGMRVVNLSLATGKRQQYAAFHGLVDEAVFRDIALVAAISNMPGRSYPAQFSGVFSVASHDAKDPFGFDRNPRPPAEWGAPGIDLKVAWLDGEDIVATGNSFATPHIAALLTLILAKHPSLSVFQAKTVLSALARNAQA